MRPWGKNKHGISELPGIKVKRMDQCHWSEVTGYCVGGVQDKLCSTSSEMLHNLCKRSILKA